MDQLGRRATLQEPCAIVALHDERLRIAELALDPAGAKRGARSSCRHVAVSFLQSPFRLREPVTRDWDIQRRQDTGPAWGPQLFREVFAVKIAIWGVTFPPPQVGHATFAAARSATVSTTSKLFLQRSHMNVYVGIGFLPAGLPAFASRAKRVWI
jgi:hypothetical protein